MYTFANRRYRYIMLSNHHCELGSYSSRQSSRCQRLWLAQLHMETKKDETRKWDRVKKKEMENFGIHLISHSFSVASYYLLWANSQQLQLFHIDCMTATHTYTHKQYIRLRNCTWQLPIRFDLICVVISNVITLACLFLCISLNGILPFNRSFISCAPIYRWLFELHWSIAEAF